jgi:type VI secretion system protein VasG
VGEPGVGKSAVVEGLALLISQNEVPDFLKNTRLLSLDLGALEAGAIKGEFENRLRGVIEEIKASTTPVILFIDEAHMLIAPAARRVARTANLLKPALAVASCAPSPPRPGRGTKISRKTRPWRAVSNWSSWTSRALKPPC